VAQRVRFMHNGQFKDLKSVLMHYDHDIKLNPNLDASLMNTSRTAPAQMNLTEQEINALEAFLHTLTDEQIIRDEKFSNPFR
jgi:cytochrome c peroxidase